MYQSSIVRLRPVPEIGIISLFTTLTAALLNWYGPSGCWHKSQYGGHKTYKRQLVDIGLFHIYRLYIKNTGNNIVSPTPFLRVPKSSVRIFRTWGLTLLLLLDFFHKVFRRLRFLWNYVAPTMHFLNKHLIRY